jgi:hypothetical protein
MLCKIPENRSYSAELKCMMFISANIRDHETVFYSMKDALEDRKAAPKVCRKHFIPLD